MKTLVSSEWLSKNINKVKIFDATWHLPGVIRNAFEEYKKCHIKIHFFLTLTKTLTKKHHYHTCLQQRWNGKKLFRTME